MNVAQPPKRVEIDGEQWLSNFSKFKMPTEKKLLKSWEQHFKRLNIRTKIIGKGKERELLINEAEHLEALER